MLMNGTLQKLLVTDLDKYLDHHEINRQRKKKNETVLITIKHLHYENSNDIEQCTMSAKQYLKDAKKLLLGYQVIQKTVQVIQKKMKS